jgi:chromate reductase
VRILGISGSVRRGSHNLTLLRAAEAQLPPNAEFEAWRGVADLPAYDEDLDAAGAPVAVAALRLAISRADAAIIATCEYNRSIPGALKNALDWASRPWPEDPHLRHRLAEIVAALLEQATTSAQASASPVGHYVQARETTMLAACGLPRCRSRGEGVSDQLCA